MRIIRQQSYEKKIEQPTIDGIILAKIGFWNGFGTQASGLFFPFCGFSAVFPVFFVSTVADKSEKPINRAFRKDCHATFRVVSPFVHPSPFRIWPFRPMSRVKMCKTAFHILYTEIQIFFL
jgi:hypothetical protein